MSGFKSLFTTTIAYLFLSTLALACNESELIRVINQTTDQKTPLGKKFKESVEDGWSPVRVLYDLTSKDSHPLLDSCRHELEEYLNKVGYPPAH
jgi:hypothetical protein